METMKYYVFDITMKNLPEPKKLLFKADIPYFKAYVIDELYEEIEKLKKIKKLSEYIKNITDMFSMIIENPDKTIITEVWEDNENTLRAKIKINEFYFTAIKSLTKKVFLLDKFLCVEPKDLLEKLKKSLKETYRCDDVNFIQMHEEICNI
ncbi:MAG: hypothetical protein QXD48_03835 [Candidatus Aenigmatarchaeota archaeon]